MFRFFLSKANENTQRIAFAFDDEGFAYALVDNKNIKRPLIIDCGFIAATQPSELESALTNLAKILNAESNPCSLVLAPDSYTLSLVEAPDVAEHEKKEALKWKIKDYADFNADESAFDYIDLPESKAAKKKMCYSIFAKLDLINKYQELLKTCGFSVDVIDIPEMATKTIANYVKENSDGEAFIKLNPKQSKVILVKDSIIYLMRNIEVDITDLYHRREDLDKKIREIQEKQLIDDLALEIQRSLDYCVSTLRHATARSIICSPAGFITQGFLDELHSVLGLPCRMVNCNEIFETLNDIPLDQQQKCFSALGAATRRSV